MNKITYRVGISGKMSFMGRAIEAFSEEIVPIAKSQGMQEAEDHVANRPELKQNPRLTAFIDTDSIIQIVWFLGGWGVKKSLDELFGQKVKTGVRNLIERARNNIPLNTIETVEYRSVICSSQDRPIVVIRSIFEDDDTLSDMINCFRDAHLYADHWITTNGAKGPIHCHTISNGSCALIPEIYETVENITSISSTVRDWPTKNKL
jgi:hypothetical protein